MKSALYGTAVLVFICAGAGLQFMRLVSSDQQDVVPRQRAVYVDTARLVHLHPGWEALKEMRAALAEVRASDEQLEAAAGKSTVGNNVISGERLESDSVQVPSRDQLEAECARSATDALSQLEQQKREAMDVRLRTARKSMMLSADIHANSKIHEIEAEARKQIAAVEEKYAPGRLNAQVKLAALKTSNGAAGADAKQAKVKMKAAEDEVTRLENVRAAEIERIEAVKKSKIELVGTEEAAEIERWVENYEKQESSRISSGIDEARQEVLQQMDECKTIRVTGAKIKGVSSRLKSAAGIASVDRKEMNGRADVVELDSAAAALEQRIRKDVDRAVRALAVRQGIKVSFARRDNGMKDATETFAELMKKYSWRSFGPAVSEARGS